MRKYKSKSTKSTNQMGIKIKDSIVVFAGLALFILLVFLYIFGETNLPIGQGCVAVVKIEGPITTESEPPSLFSVGKPGSYEIAQTFESLNKEDRVKAVVIEVNSPGGGVVASREIYEGILSLKKPKVAYIREIGASGGYYVSLAADEIIANPDAITGSIGVIATFTDLRGLLDKLGVNVTSIKSGEYKDIGAFYNELSEGERKILQELIDETYGEFYGLVKERRGEKLKGFDSIADGRILSGRQALKYGLVDANGNFKDAIKRAADLAGMEYEDKPELCYYSAVDKANPFSGMLSGFKINIEISEDLIRIKS